MSILRIRCRLFARYAELLGRDEVTVELPAPAVVSDAVRRLRDVLPEGRLLPERPLVAVNQRHVLPGEPLADGDELALFPPLAGG
ncbi:MAG TPA: MoaD/ThiS family protein [Gemmatimonadales bacterium]